ncbi:hypothetical protein CC86DRAFT_45160 [Ophiobolus disseminans]|uniref:Uncharacterized protein n=1 Tax=Ophiobolus disseminans TaxID=1469910 RepID=A0A6A6ZUV4_9PLEO|nr:hypothetical protein CC86DRAFT_45160 [Ophiobolus disseminans]
MHTYCYTKALLNMDFDEFFSYPAASTDYIEEKPSLDLPYRLCTPMRLDVPHHAKEVFSPSPIIINNVVVWSATSIRILGNGSGKDWPIMLKSAASLGPSFVRGWAKLPGEIKENIVSFNLVSDEPEYHDHHSLNRTLDRALLHLLHSTPEIAGISHDVYYKYNVFRLYPRHDISGPISLPPPSFLKYPTHPSMDSFAQCSG